MSNAIFVGPSIYRAHLPEIPGVEIVRPIRRGDLQNYEECEVLIILDGEFNQNLAVSPKELLRAIDRGQRIIGASSMGALRASELDSFGMIGVGWVYEHFARSTVRRDDDVALTYNPITFAPLTVPMVNVLYWIESMLKTGRISVRESKAVVKTARNIFYVERSEKMLLRKLSDVLGSSYLQSLLDQSEGRIPDIKELDGLKAIQVGCRISSEAIAQH